MYIWYWTVTDWDNARKFGLFHASPNPSLIFTYPSESSWMVPNTVDPLED